MNPSFFKKLGPININIIKKIINCDTENVSNEDYFNELVSLDNVSKNSLSFLYDNEKFKGDLPADVCIICSKSKKKLINPKQKLLIVKNVQEAVSKLSNAFYRDFTDEEKSKFNNPIIGDRCVIKDTALIENGVVIGNDVKIDHGVVIKHNCIIGNGVKIESNSIISNSILGENTYIGSNSSIGQQGFGFFLSNMKNINIFHIGKVIIRSNSSVGSGCTIDRGSFSDTIIGKNTYLDNLCHVAHNVEIGDNCAFAAMTGIAGSAKVGNNVLTGGQAGIAGHIKIGNDVKIAAKSGVFNNLADGVSVMGNPAVNMYKFIKSYKKTHGKR